MNLANTLELFANRKLHYRTAFQGLPISVENRKGSIRRGYDAKWGHWSTKMRVPYGYIRGTTGADGDGVDVFIGRDPNSKFAYVVHVNKQPNFKTYDEDKVLLGFSSPAEAKACFMQHYDDSRFFGGMEQIPMEEFKKKVLSTKGKPQKLDGKKLEGAIELQRMMAGGPGSGCKGPNCGRKPSGDEPEKISGNPLKSMVPGMAAIQKPDGSFDVGPHWSHLKLIEKGGFEGYNDFFRKGGIRIEVDAGNTGVIEFGLDDKEVVEKAIRIIHDLPTMKFQLDYHTINHSGLMKPGGFFLDGDEKTVVGGIRKWWTTNHKEEELAADSGEPGVYPGGYGHIQPVPSFHPPSLRNPKRVPTSDPMETDDSFMDVSKREEARKQRDQITKQHTDANMRPLNSTLVQGFPSGTIGGFG